MTALISSWRNSLTSFVSSLFFCDIPQYSSSSMPTSFDLEVDPAPPWKEVPVFFIELISRGANLLPVPELFFLEAYSFSSALSGEMAFSFPPLFLAYAPLAFGATVLAAAFSTPFAPVLVA